MPINTETLNKLIESYHDDEDALNMIEELLAVFEAYHTAIYGMETKLLLYSHGMAKDGDYQKTVEELDRTRTTRHNAVLARVNILNRMAKQYDLAPFYDGVVSEERPYRREVANAVLAFVETIIENRR